MSIRNTYLHIKREYLMLSNGYANKTTNQIIGGNNNSLIIHICGASGSGKTTIGNKLLKKFKNEIIIKDMDDLRREFIKQKYGNNKIQSFDENGYQAFLDEYIAKTKLLKKPIIITGLNNMPWWNRDHYYNLYSNYNFYIDLDDDIIFKQKCWRYLSGDENFRANKDNILNDFIKNNKKMIEMFNDALQHECNYDLTIKETQKWNNDYRKQGYIFMSRNDIIKKVAVIIGNNVKSL